jgi:hypothetical protein
MSGWWAEWSSYRPSDFLMFAPATYWRLFELANRAAWPAPLAAIGVGAAWCGWAFRAPGSAAGRAGAAALALACATSGWFFVHQRYAAINWAAEWLAVALGLQALLFALLAVLPRLRRAAPRRRHFAWVLIAWAVLLQPLLALAQQRPWTQAEVLGIAPDPTLIAALGLLLWLQPTAPAQRALWCVAWIVPVLGALASAATLAVVGSSQALVLPAALLLAGVGLRVR